MPITIAASAHIGEANTWAARSSCVVGSNYYTLVEQSSGPLLMRKSTDQGATWATMDSANGPTPSALTPPAGSYDTYRAGNYIYVVYQFATGSVGRVRRFNHTTDTWETTDVGNASINTACDFQRPVRVAVRSDGDVLVWRYNGTGLQMAKWQPSVWNNTTALAAGYPHDLIMTAADVAIGSYKDTAGNDESWVTVTGADVQASGDFDTTAHTTIHPRGGQMATYNDGTNDKFFTLSLDATGSTMDGYHSTANTAPAGSLVNALTSVTPQTGSWACAAYGGQVYVVWAEANLIKYLVSTSLTVLTFAAEVTLISGLTDTDPCPTLLADGAGSVLTVIYQDGGDVKHEYIVAPAVTHQLTGTSAGIGSSTAAATITNELAGTSAGIGADSGNLDVITGGGATHQITGTSAGVGASPGTIRLANALTATSAGLGGMSASLGVTQHVIGTSPGVGGVTGAIAITRSLTVTSAGIGDAFGAIGQTLQLSGTSPGIGGSSGTLVEAGVQQLTGTSAGIGGQSGAVTIANRIGGTAAGIGAASGSLRLTMALDGQSLGAGDMSGTLRLVQELLGIISPSVGSESGSLSVTLQLTGTSPGIGGASASFEAETPTGKLTGQIILRQPLTGRVIARSTLNGDIQIIRTVSGLVEVS